MEANESIWVFGIEDRDERGLFDRLSELRYGREQVSLEDMKGHLYSFLAGIKQLVKELDVSDEFGEFRLDQVQVAVEVSASGKVSLMGTGGEVAGKGGLTFTLSRKETSSPKA